jgi:transcription antitermination factor NusG
MSMAVVNSARRLACQVRRPIILANVVLPNHRMANQNQLGALVLGRLLMVDGHRRTVGFHRQALADQVQRRSSTSSCRRPPDPACETAPVRHRETVAAAPGGISGVPEAPLGVGTLAFESPISSAFQDLGLPQHSLPWFALRTRSNFERVCALSLSQKGYEPFLPVYQCRRRRWDRTVDVELPLFPGYLFCRFDFQRRLPILMSPGIVHVVGGRIALEPAPEVEIATVRAIVESNLRAEPWPFLKIGERVRIFDGPLEGVEGLLVGSKRRHRLVVSITLLQRSIAAEIDARWVRPARKSVAHPTAPEAVLAAAAR